jgi:phage terminase small subunit
MNLKDKVMNKNLTKEELESILTDKQVMFAYEYVADEELNASRAYSKVYSGCKTEQALAASASRLLKNVKVAAYVNILMEDRKKRLEYSADDIIKDLISVKTRCMQAEPVKIWDYELKEFVETGEYTFDSKGANQALKLLGDHLGMFNKGKLDIQASLNGNVTIVDDIPRTKRKSS